ncbi:MAG: Flp family type IVb pilin [Caldilinea sp.]|uniref:Flp family type IVb pilin n=1 Tax=Caldilinea sp. TaxID=2293560 RepID=UPI002BD61BDB|nr:Flp family type IVb pilin [Anaerolineales bacterium]HQY91287.1 Flp family type IVb pilin [Caldilinea sp.]HRA65236.1 Flp family type IVb pilin [Caldilinea sp.]
MITYYYLILKSYMEREEGQDLIEYALIAGLLALAAVVALGALGGSIQSMWDALATAVEDAMP